MLPEMNYMMDPTSPSDATQSHDALSGTGTVLDKHVNYEGEYVRRDEGVDPLVTEYAG